MPKLYIGDERIRKVYIGEDRIKKIYIGNDLVFSDSHVVTYHINTNDIRQVEVDDGENALDSQWAPTATLSGFTFVGWRQDTQANPSVLPSKTVTEDNIHLYAVFSRVLTLTYNGNGATGGSTLASTGTQYYNNGNYGNPSITLRANGFTKANTVSATEYSYTFTGWNLGAAGATVTISNSTIAWAQWQAIPTGRVFMVYNGVIQPGFSFIALDGTTYTGSAVLNAPYARRWIRLNANLKSMYPNTTLYIQTSYTGQVGSYGHFVGNNGPQIVISSADWAETGSMTSSPKFDDVSISENGGTIAIPTNSTNTTIYYNGEHAGQFVTFGSDVFNDGGYRDITVHNMWVQ